MEAEYPDWPSSGNILLQIFEFRTEIEIFLNQEDGHQTIIIKYKLTFLQT